MERRIRVSQIYEKSLASRVPRLIDTFVFLISYGVRCSRHRHGLGRGSELSEAENSWLGLSQVAVSGLCGSIPSASRWENQHM